MAPLVVDPVAYLKFPPLGRTQPARALSYWHNYPAAVDSDPLRHYQPLRSSSLTSREPAHT